MAEDRRLPKRDARRAITLAMAVALAPSGATARTLEVGEGRAYALPSTAISAARPGDTVSIQPGRYFDCAVIGTPGLTIEGVGDATGVAMTDATCQGKAILVIGADAVVRNLTLARARVPDGNGAGIRHEGGDLAVSGVRFENDQVGILSGATGGDVTIVDSAFAGGGVGGERPKSQVMVGALKALVVGHSSFSPASGGMVSSNAATTQLTGNRFSVPTGQRPATMPIDVGDGALQLIGNRFSVGAGPTPPAMAGIRDDATAVARANTVTGDGGTVALLRDWSENQPEAAGNALRPGDQETTTDGAWRYRLASGYHGVRQRAHEVAAWTWHRARDVVRRP